MLEEGLLVTVNSDDPPYFGGYVDANYAAIREHFGEEALLRFARNAIDASFASAERKASLRQQFASRNSAPAGRSA